MGKKFLLASIITLFAGATALMLTRPCGSVCESVRSDQKTKTLAMSGGEENEESSEKKREMIRARYEQEFKKTVDPNLGYVPRERLALAYEQMMAMSGAGKVTAAIPGVDWTERGPNNVSGRTRTMLVDPNDGTGRTVFAAGVAGGLWKTTDITANPPVWTRINDFFSNMAISSIAADPTNPLVMYFGTGEGYFNLDAVRGDGIWKTTDGGTTWNQLAATTGANFRYVQKVVVNSTGVVLAATSTGVRRSADGGTTWTKVLGSGMGITGAVSNFSYDVEIASDGDIYASLDQSIHRSTNAGSTWSAAQTLPITGNRIELACAPSDAGYLYAIVESGSGVNGILRTTNDGTTWTSRTEPADPDPGIPDTDFSRGQAWYDLAIAVDPSNRDVLMVGGVDLFKSTDGANTWTMIAHWYGGFSSQYVHADQHYILFRPGSSTEAYFCNDGGIYRTTNANAAVPTITFKGDNYNVTQFYACAIHPTAFTDYFLAGAQDNGSQQFNSAGIDATVEATGGDGAFCHIDQDQPLYQFTSYVYNDYYRSADGGNTWTGASGPGGMFINPSDYDNVNNKMYACRSNNNYLRWDNPQTGATFTTITVAGFGGIVTAVTVSPNTANRVFFGIDIGDVFRVDNAHTGTPTATNVSTGLPASYISCVEVETGNDNHLLVTYSNYGVNSIWESTNGGTSWTSVEGNLPDMPVRWALFNPNNADQAMIATELGVWTTDDLNGGATNWGASNTGLANVRTDMLQMRQSDKMVIAATHARGLYSSDAFTNPTALFHSDRHVNYITRPIQFIDDSYNASSWSWDFGDGGTSTLQNPSYAYSTAGVYTVTLTINAGADTETKTSYITILPDLGTPYAPADGGNFEVNINHFAPENWNGTLWQRGSSAVAGKSGTTSPSNAWVTGLAGNYVDNTNAELWCPTYNFTAAGTYTLRFQGKYATETGYDGYRVEYSTNKGVTWLPLGTTTAAGWYNFANTVGDAVFPINEAFFAGSSTTYALRSRDVSFLAGNPMVSFRFVFKSDINTVSAGAAIDDFEIVGPSNPGGLPVEASPLTARWNGDNAMIEWKTIREENNAGFTLQRSADGLHFTDIGFVKGAGTTQAEKEYAFEDKNPSGSRFYYRYVQHDVNGTTSFSNVAELSRTGVFRWTVEQVFPNPFRDEVNLRFSALPSDEISLSVYDASGRMLYAAASVHAPQGYITLREPWENLGTGVYFIRITCSGSTETAKVVKY